NFNGERIDSVIIKIKNFRDDIGNYNGSYKEVFNFTGELGNFLAISGRSDSVGGLNYGNDGNIESSQIDFKVYWFGQVDVWFDKMTVDDEIGNNLFRGIHDGKIDDEVSNFTSQISNYTFFCDEAVYSQIPCLEYIKNKMVSYEPDSKLSYVMSDVQNRYSLRNDTVAYGTSLSRVEPKVFFCDPYVIPWEIPDNMSFPGAQQLSSAAYNDTLQRILGDKNSVLNAYENSFIKQIDLARTKRNLNSPGSEFFVIPQLFGYMKKANTGNSYVEFGQREPTNQETEAQAMLSIAQGADGLGWFIYQSSKWVGSSLYEETWTGGHGGIVSPPQDLFYDFTYYIYALLNPDSSKRTSNIFGQNKWDYVSKMNLKILHWKPTLDNISWQNGYSIHSEGANYNFISEIKSIYRDPSSPYAFTITNEDAVKYWEMGFFNPDDATDKSKYFIMVNRRCVPDVNNDGDLRGLRIKFDSTDLSGFINWKITELDTNNVVATFNKNTTSYINMGEFN
ncbi:MAG: hypothetical protein JNJ56_15180, partial [Ignavibacteria bacterium]|nr:hypothetical protein [Ignavibacteria bacterium]